MTDTTTTRTPAGYIATDANQDSGAIYGIGSTPERARADALREAGYGDRVNFASDFQHFGLVAATARLISSVKANGGAPQDQDWSIYHGDEPIGATLPTDPDDVRDYLIADLDTEELS